MVETSPMKMRSESICEIFESAPRVKLSQALPIPKQLEQGPIPQSVEGKGFSNSGTALAAVAVSRIALASRSEEHTSELQSLMRISYAVFCLKKKTHKNTIPH